MHQQVIVARRYPALALHVQAAAWREGLRRQRLLQLFGSDGPGGGKTIDLEILEPHEDKPEEAKAAILHAGRLLTAHSCRAVYAESATVNKPSCKSEFCSAFSSARRTPTPSKRTGIARR